MIGISVAAKREWDVVLGYFEISEKCKTYPFGEYFIINIKENNVIFYFTGSRKVNSAAANQYMICNYKLTKIIVIGTCAGIDDRFSNLDIIIPNKAVQYDCTVKEMEPLIKNSFTVSLDISCLDFEYKTGTIGTADKAVVVWNDYLELKRNEITIADTESAGVAYVCKQNNTKCLIVKGISDFPIKDDDKRKKEKYVEQFNTYVENTSKVMKKILCDYLERII